ncbi:hypothetical protein AB6E04_07385 [Vibrio amylolyticus]|uniref:hypothetical protein n=1 Tax=Vibrio amylolyticus TaxID=2847292 RepID=UPI003552F678
MLILTILTTTVASAQVFLSETVNMHRMSAFTVSTDNSNLENSITLDQLSASDIAVKQSTLVRYGSSLVSSKTSLLVQGPDCPDSDHHYKASASHDGCGSVCQFKIPTYLYGVKLLAQAHSLALIETEQNDTTKQLVKTLYRPPISSFPA